MRSYCVITAGRRREGFRKFHASLDAAKPAMRITVDPSTGVRVQVWREQQLFHAARGNAVEPPQICLGIDLFEVIAELAGLDLERPAEAEEAGRLAQDAQQRLAGEKVAEQPGLVEHQPEREQAT